MDPEEKEIEGTTEEETKETEGEVDKGPVALGINVAETVKHKDGLV